MSTSVSDGREIPALRCLEKPSTSVQIVMARSSCGPSSRPAQRSWAEQAGRGPGKLARDSPKAGAPSLDALSCPSFLAHAPCSGPALCLILRGKENKALGPLSPGRASRSLGPGPASMGGPFCAYWQRSRVLGLPTLAVGISQSVPALGSGALPFSVCSLALFPALRMYSDPIDPRWRRRRTRRQESRQKQMQGACAWKPGQQAIGLLTRKLAEAEECHLHGLCAWGRRERGYPRKQRPEWVQFLLLRGLCLSVSAILGIWELAQKC